MNHYETVFILNPVLSEDQVKEAVQKYANIITSNGGELVDQEDWGLKKFAYTIQNKKSGFYHLFDFTAAPEVVHA
ncbi:MAG: 30S ribosomal protein S6, partial [Flavobacteriaceae bacterium]|nr:30S ribosomal protein S6 [Flavobacteriaceae bacterium]